MIKQEAEMKSYLVEIVYQGKLHEPFGIYHCTTIDTVVESLFEEVDKNGYTEELGEGIIKFISPNNLPSYWIIGEYVN